MIEKMHYATGRWSIRTVCRLGLPAEKGRLPHAKNTFFCLNIFDFGVNSFFFELAKTNSNYFTNTRIMI